jgi:acetyltransferase-like isoleucine patch superfamily enzyme
MSSHYCHGNPNRLHIGQRVSTVNTLFNTSSGDIYVGDDTIFGHNVMVLTGHHEFARGQRREISTGEPEIPRSGYNVSIGKGCWIASGAIIIGGVTIGDNVIVAASAVVTRDVASGTFVAGIPARVLRSV